MALQLFDHNKKAYKVAVNMMQQYGKAAIVHPTGTGKSYIAFKLIEDHPDEVIFWLSPVSTSSKPNVNAYCTKTRTSRCKTCISTPMPNSCAARQSN